MTRRALCLVASILLPRRSIHHEPSNLLWSHLIFFFPFPSGMIWAGCTIWQYLSLLGNFIAGDVGKNTDLAFSLEDLIFVPLHRIGYLISRTNENCKWNNFTLWSKHREKAFPFFPLSQPTKGRSIQCHTTSGLRPLSEWLQSLSDVTDGIHPARVPSTYGQTSARDWGLWWLLGKIGEARTENWSSRAEKKVRGGITHKQRLQVPCHTPLPHQSPST